MLLNEIILYTYIVDRAILWVQISLLQTGRILIAVFDALVAAINGDTSNSATGVT